MGRKDSWILFSLPFLLNSCCWSVESLSFGTFSITISALFKDVCSDWRRDQSQVDSVQDCKLDGAALFSRILTFGPLMYGSVLSCKINKTLRNISGSSLKIFGWKTFRRRCLYYTAVTIALFKTQSVAIMPPLYKTKIIVSLPNVKCPFKLILYDMIPTCFWDFDLDIYYALINYFWDNPCIHTLSAAVVSNRKVKPLILLHFYLHSGWNSQV